MTVETLSKRNSRSWYTVFAYSHLPAKTIQTLTITHPHMSDGTSSASEHAEILWGDVTWAALQYGLVVAMTFVLLRKRREQRQWSTGQGATMLPSKLCSVVPTHCPLIPSANTGILLSSPSATTPYGRFMNLARTLYIRTYRKTTFPSPKDRSANF